MTETGKARLVAYAVKSDGYQVQVLDGDNQPIKEYRAGNHPLDSQTYLPKEHPRALNYDTLLEYAQRTAREMAAEYGLTEEALWHDTDEETEE